MKHSILLAGIAFWTVPGLLGCSDPNGGGGEADDGDEKGGSSGTGTGGGSNGGSSNGGSSNGGTSGSGGSSGSGAGECSNANPMTLPIDESGWVARECNDRNIQGAFYCYDDGINPTSCPPEVDGTRPPPYRAGVGMCISGNLTIDPMFDAWGAGLGLSLNETGGTDSSKDAYNATMNNVTGFHLEISGNTGMRPLRVGFTGSATPMDAQPFVEFAAGLTSFDVNIQDALVPSSWDDPNAGTAADPTAIYDLQVQIPGAESESTYDFCITQVTPITSGDPVGGTLMPFGGQLCNTFQTVDLTGRYMVQNNLYNAMGGTQCTTAAWDMGANAGLVVNPVNLNVPSGGAPASYPSIVLGWHYGTFYGSYTAARRFSEITSIPSSFTFTVPPSGRYNASYDAWIHPSTANPANPTGGVELMIWLNKRDTTPIGSSVGTVMIGGTSWDVWFGNNAGGWTTVSYIRATNTASVSNLDLRPFFGDAVTRGYTSDSSYLLGVQAGFEIWQQNEAMTINTYTIAVN
jgi:hypothetical protein